MAIRAVRATVRRVETDPGSFRVLVSAWLCHPRDLKPIAGYPETLTFDLERTRFSGDMSGEVFTTCFLPATFSHEPEGFIPERCSTPYTPQENLIRPRIITGSYARGTLPFPVRRKRLWLSATPPGSRCGSGHAAHRQWSPFSDRVSKCSALPVHVARIRTQRFTDFQARKHFDVRMSGMLTQELIWHGLRKASNWKGKWLPQLGRLQMVASRHNQGGLGIGHAMTDHCNKKASSRYEVLGFARTRNSTSLRLQDSRIKKPTRTWELQLQ